MENNTKLTEDELNQVQELQNSYAEITAQFGQIRIERILLDNQLKRLELLETTLTTEYINIQAKEEVLAKELSDKYGNGAIDIETGTINTESPSV